MQKAAKCVKGELKINSGMPQSIYKHKSASQGK